jgi:GNAT superfamily N-acetyltransferase
MAEVLLSAATTGALREEQLPQALLLSQALNWPYRPDDWRDALGLGHGLGVEVDGRLGATALWWPWGERHATCGMIIVAPHVQGRGVGRALMGALLHQAGDRTVLLNSTVAGTRLYEQYGFVPFGRVHQHQAPLTRAPPPPVAEANVRWMGPDDVPALNDLDCEASGMERRRLLDALVTAGRVAVVAPGARPSGYACVRRWGRGVVIGPVVAGDAGDARTLIATLLQGHVGEFVRLDVTDESGLSPWLAELGLPRVDGVTSMARGPLPLRSQHHTVLALASQSLG